MSTETMFNQPGHNRADPSLQTSVLPQDAESFAHCPACRQLPNRGRQICSQHLPPATANRRRPGPKSGDDLQDAQEQRGNPAYLTRSDFPLRPVNSSCGLACSICPFLQSTRAAQERTAHRDRTCVPSRRSLVARKGQLLPPAGDRPAGRSHRTLAAIYLCRASAPAGGGRVGHRDIIRRQPVCSEGCPALASSLMVPLRPLP